MEIPRIFESEYRFCLILWEEEPINSTRLVEKCREQLGWTKATTYTVIRRLAQRGILVNENATVRTLVSKEDAQQARLEEMVAETFEGSMPTFLAAFSRQEKLTQEDIRQLQDLLNKR